ncbi:MAG: glycogen synthase GlgA [Eubacteriales bacterium]|nr:glycogen synthase GlgA [Eubacteriales bacterium]
MKVLLIGSEAVPFASTGGLGDVMGSLPAALKAEQPDTLDIRVILPLYSSMRHEYREKLTRVCELVVPLAWRQQYCGVFMLEEKGVVYYFLDNEYYFKRAMIYGNYDDGERYAFFCRAIPEVMHAISFYPDILHANDWQSALSVVYLRTKFRNDPAFWNTRTIYTIHNIEYQGKYGHEILWDVFDLPQQDHSLLDYDGCINLTKAAIVCCDRLTTVSPHYAKEIQEPYFAHGLEHIIRQNAHKISGILNGIDTAYYDPSNPADVLFPFNMQTVSRCKPQNKLALQQLLGLPEAADVPMIAMITRLTAHKGLDLVKAVLEQILSGTVQFVLLGTGDSSFESFFADTARRHPDKVAAVLRFDKALSKQIYAAADLFLMPSRSEPCGLSQMIASRYGTVPIVHQVGGLADTIHPFQPQTQKGNGITFYGYDAYDMLDAVMRGIHLYEQTPADFRTLRKNAMEQDFSWTSSAKQYLALYHTLCGQTA